MRCRQSCSCSHNSCWKVAQCSTIKKLQIQPVTRPKVHLQYFLPFLVHATRRVSEKITRNCLFFSSFPRSLKSLIIYVVPCDTESLVPGCIITNGDMPGDFLILPNLAIASCIFLPMKTGCHPVSMCLLLNSLSALLLFVLWSSVFYSCRGRFCNS